MDLQDEVLQEAEDLAKRSALYQSRLPPPLVNHSRLSAVAEDELLDECNEIWKELGELAVLLARERALLAELSVQKNRVPKPLPINQEVLTCLGKQELQNADKQLEMILSCVRTKKKSLQEQLEREQKWLQEQLELEKTLQEKHEDQQQNFLTLSENSVIQKMKMKMEKVTLEKENLLTALGNFLDVHYPPPSEVEATGKKKRLAPKRGENTANLITFHEILEHLMTKSMKSPQDPYVEVSESFWPPYVEALLRYGVVSRHPEDPHRIRLEDFHE
ncbi:centromere protein K isoform X2 [Heptranchias perlo]|uniref:centromere protein K isoform X2 n=1 Tax=Heptranchias perlo TaxID=212740 RepID=UPI00355A9803